MPAGRGLGLSFGGAILAGPLARVALGLLRGPPLGGGGGGPRLGGLAPTEGGGRGGAGGPLPGGGRTGAADYGAGTWGAVKFTGFEGL